MVSPAEAGQKAFEKAQDAADYQAAALLKEYFPALTFVAPELKVPGVTQELQALLKKPADQQNQAEIAELEKQEIALYKTMAKELMESGTLTQTIDRKTVTITVQDIDKKINASDALKEKFEPFKERFKVNSFKEGIQKLATLKKDVSEAVEQSTTENTGTIGFLRGATLMDAIIGFFKWIANLFTGGGKSLTESIASVTAGDISQSVSEKLQNYRSNNPDMAPLLQDNRITEIANATRSGVMAEVGFQDANTYQPQQFRDIKPMTIHAAELKEGIRQGVLHPDGLGGSLEDRIAKQYSEAVTAAKKNAAEGRNVGKVHIPGSGLLGSVVALATAPKEEAIKKTSKEMAEVIADSVAATVTNSDFIDPKTGKKLSVMVKEERIKAITDAVGESLVRNEARFNLPDKSGLLDKNAEGKTYLDIYKENIHAGLAEGYNKLEPVITAIGQESAKEVAQRVTDQTFTAQARDAREAGTSPPASSQATPQGEALTGMLKNSTSRA